MARHSLYGLVLAFVGFLLIVKCRKTLAGSCSDQQISHWLYENTLTINFFSAALLKFDRSIICSSNSTRVKIESCFHQCNGLPFGLQDQALIEFQLENRTVETCFIDYEIPLKRANIIKSAIEQNQLRLTIERPFGLFDYVVVRCVTNESFVLFNQTNATEAIIDCPILADLSLMNIILETHKAGFDVLVSSQNQEIPSRIPFRFEIDSLSLIIFAESPPAINMNTTYDFTLLHENLIQSNKSIEVAHVTSIDPRFGAFFQYGLLPNQRYTILFRHGSSAIGFIEHRQTLITEFNETYPYPAKTVYLHENSNDLRVSWDDPHALFDPIDFWVLCDDATGKSYTNVGRNTSFRCPSYVRWNTTRRISIITRAAHDSSTTGNLTAFRDVIVEEFPPFPRISLVETKSDRFLFKRMTNYTSSEVDGLVYTLLCGIENPEKIINIQLLEYECDSLIPGMIHQIVMTVWNPMKNIKRIRTFISSTVADRVQFKQHFFSPDLNGSRSILLEVQAPSGFYDLVRVDCPYSSLTFSRAEFENLKYVNCSVQSGAPFQISFESKRNRVPSAFAVFEGIAPETAVDVRTTNLNPVTSPLFSTTPNSVQSTVTTQMGNGTYSTTTSSGLTVSLMNRTSSAIYFSTSSTVFASTTINSTPMNQSTSVPIVDQCEQIQKEIDRWRMLAVIGFATAGFLSLTTLGLAMFSCVLCFRNR